MITLVKNDREEKDLSVTELCEMLSISDATAKNWIKLNKIKPNYIKNSVPYFSKEYVNSLIEEIKSDSSNTLKSRRNKKFISGSFFYKDYIFTSSKNLDKISSLLDFILSNELNLSESEKKYIISDCAIQLLLQKKQIKHTVSKLFLSSYLRKEINFNAYNSLIDDLIDDKKQALNFINNYPELFCNNYIYEKNEDILGLLYISLSNLGNRKSKGAYYTPTKIVQKIVNLYPDCVQNKKILDPACGSGNFLIQLPDNICVENIYGNDIDNNAIKITRINMALKFKFSDIDILYKNFKNKDFLVDDEKISFDYIIGNPPWGADFTKEKIDILRKKYVTTKNKKIESYDVFIENALNRLNTNGILSFVLPESILSVKTHKEIRNIILKNTSIIYLEYLGNIFNKVQCPSIILELKYTKQPFSCNGINVVNGNKKFVIHKERPTTPKVFSFSMNDEEYSVYEKLLNNRNKLYLKDNAIFALGLVTGNNKKYITNTKNNKNEIVLKGSDIDKYRITQPKSYIEYTPEKLQQVAPTEYYRAKEKLLYKFISKKLVFAYDNKQTLSLNSCNILIPKLNGYDIKYIMAILNSRIAQFIYEKKYNSIKVLRSHIEGIPIPVCDKENQTKIIKIVDKILANNNNYIQLYEKLEEKIYKLYNLSDAEYNIIKKAISE